MLLKIILVFLLAMVLVGMIGRALFPGAMRRITARRKPSPLARRCGRHQIGRASVDCGFKRKA